MGYSGRFTLVVVAWVAALALALAALAWALGRPDTAAVRIVAAGAVAAATWGLVRHVQRTNVTVARFVEALGHGDLAVRFDARGGSGFDALGAALDRAMQALQAERGRGAAEFRFLEALVDDVPVALMTVDASGGVTLVNKAARRLFGSRGGVRTDDLAAYGDDFARRLVATDTAQEVVTLRLADGPQRATVRAAMLQRLGAAVRVVSVEPVDRVLDAAEVGAQSDLVRVLTHEILNSLTPVTSLAGTAAVLLGEEEPDLAEARLAVLTLARRTEGLRRFVDSYRAVARLPEPRRRRFAAGPFAAELARLFAAEWIDHRLVLDVQDEVILDADPDLLAQALINLLRNAAQAGALSDRAGEVRLAIGRFSAGALIEVEDDGPGVPAELQRDIFLPFFTTKAQGMGVGLNLVRQIAVAHGWRIDVVDGDGRGARFRIVTGAADLPGVGSPGSGRPSDWPQNR